MRKELLRVENISKAYSGEQVLKNVSFRLFQGETLVLLGANSAGKTTLMKILSGLVRKDSGRIIFEDRPVENHSILGARQMGIQMVSDAAGVVGDLSLAENIFLSRKKPPVYNPASLAAPARHYLEAVGLYRDPLTPAWELGVVDQSKLKLAAALAMEPKVLVLDEPPLISAPEDEELLRRNLTRFKAGGGAVILITHNLDDALFYADRILILRGGTAVFMDEASAVTKSLLVSVLSQGADGEEFLAPPPSGGPFLTVRELSGTGFHPLSFSVGKGEIVGLIGPADSGNIEVLRCLSGLSRFSGEVTMDGRPVHPVTTRGARKAGISFAAGTLAAQYGLVPNMSISWNLSLRILKKLTRAGWILRRPERHFARSRLKYLYSDTVTDIGTRAGELSNGVKHKLQLTEAISARPRLLLLFEPTAGMDIASKRHVLKDIVNMASAGTSVLFAGTTEDDELLRACRRVYLMEHGRITGTLSSPDISVKNILALEQSREVL